MRHDPEICGVCARSATGISYAPQGRQNNPIMWLCDDLGCIKIARASYDMKQDQFTRIESMASGDGGMEGGMYLDTIGKTDLAELSPDEYFEFCRRLVAGYRKGLAKRTAEEAPF